MFMKRGVHFCYECRGNIITVLSADALFIVYIEAQATLKTTDIKRRDTIFSIMCHYLYEKQHSQHIIEIKHNEKSNLYRKLNNLQGKLVRVERNYRK